MATKLSNRSMTPIQEMSWFSTKTKKACKVLNGKIAEFNRLLTELVSNSKASKESEVMISQAEIEDYRKTVFELLQAEVTLREEIIEFYPDFAVPDLNKERTRIGGGFEEIDAGIVERLESIGYKKFDRAKPVQGSWKPEFVKLHPDRVNHQLSLNAIQSMPGNFGDFKRIQLEFIKDAKEELWTMTAAALPAI